MLQGYAPLEKFCSDESSLKCPKCGRYFSSVYSLRLHENQTHHRNLPYVCSICGKGVNNKEDLRGHMSSRHNRPKDFRCAVCSKEFGYERTLKKHILTVHRALKFKWSVYFVISYVSSFDLFWCLFWCFPVCSDRFLDKSLRKCSLLSYKLFLWRWAQSVLWPEYYVGLWDMFLCVFTF